MEKIQALLQKINQYEKQRKIWLGISLLFVSTLVSVIIEWKIIAEFTRPEIWTSIIVILTVTGISWWYWTMSTIKNLLVERRSEIELLVDLTNDIKTIKQEVANNDK